MAYEVDGWREFPTEPEAQDYAALTWAAIINGVEVTRIPDEFLALKQALDAAVADAAGDVRAVPRDAIEAVALVPIKGLNHLGEVVDRGYSRAWANPQLTAAGTWAVPCLAGFDTGGPVPEWPPPPLPDGNPPPGGTP